METITLKESDNGKKFQLHIGDKVVITLPLRASNGFFWQDSGSTAGPLEEVKNSGQDMTPGAVTWVSFKFNVLRSGFLTLSYARPWDENNPPSKWFEIEVEKI